MVLHITCFSVFRYLQDGPAYNPTGYLQDRPVYNISLTVILFIQSLYQYISSKLETALYNESYSCLNIFLIFRLIQAIVFLPLEEVIFTEVTHS